MRLSIKEAYDFPHQKEWHLLNGKHVEGQIVWFGPDHETVVEEGLESGFHLDMLEWQESAGREILVPRGVFSTFDEAYAKSQEAQP